MGIRFNKDTARPTNGPMLFFFNPSAEIDLSEEIRGAISSSLSFYAYRRPGDVMVSFGSSEGVVEGIGEPGFVIAPFDGSRATYTIPYRPSGNMIKSAASPDIVPVKSTTANEHNQEVNIIKDILAHNGGGKIVATRVIVEGKRLDIAATFSQLCHSYPSAFIFLFSSPLTGCWIGASPELLLESSQSGLMTMALAGTRPSGTPGMWDNKNMEEQAMVADYIMECLEKHGLNPVAEDTFSRQAGPVEHLCTPISASFPPESQLTHLLADLSPTPALCGLPKDLALDTIIKTEQFDRNYYGGFCGPYQTSEDFSFYVTLRCACLNERRYALYAGGGITSQSDSGDEWNETEMKADTLRKLLVIT